MVIQSLNYVNAGNYFFFLKKYCKKQQQKEVLHIDS
jgi:hypothetical protein